MEQTIKPYEALLQNKIPEITSYQGFLDSASAAKYADAVFSNFAFVKKIVFYDLEVGNIKNPTFVKNHLGITIRGAYQFKPYSGSVIGERKKRISEETDFTEMAIKLGNYIENSDTARSSTQDEIFKTFYDIRPNKISYSNILRREDVKILRELEKQGNSPSFSQQDMMTFFLDPFLLTVKNPHKELYQNINIQPVVYYPLDNNSDNLVTEVALPGAFSDFKLYFSSAKVYLNAELTRWFLPIGALLLLIYVFLALIAWLIYRNLNVNLSCLNCSMILLTILHMNLKRR